MADDYLRSLFVGRELSFKILARMLIGGNRPNANSVVWATFR